MHRQIFYNGVDWNDRENPAALQAQFSAMSEDDQYQILKTMAQGLLPLAQADIPNNLKLHEFMARHDYLGAVLGLLLRLWVIFAEAPEREIKPQFLRLITVLQIDCRNQPYHNFKLTNFAETLWGALPYMTYAELLFKVMRVYSDGEREGLSKADVNFICRYEIFDHAPQVQEIMHKIMDFLLSLWLGSGIQSRQEYPYFVDEVEEAVSLSRQYAFQLSPQIQKNISIVIKVTGPDETIQHFAQLYHECSYGMAPWDYVERALSMLNDELYLTRKI